MPKEYSVTPMTNRARPVILLETKAGNSIQGMCELALDHARRWGQVVVFEFNGNFMYADPRDNYSDVIVRYRPLFTSDPIFDRE